MDKKKYHIGGTTVETDKPFKERSKADFYPTEQALIDTYVKKTRFIVLENEQTVIADLGAGDGRWGLAVKKKYPKSTLFGTDIRDLPIVWGFDSWRVGYPLGDIYNLHNLFEDEFIDVIVGNPPYNIAFDWFKICLANINKSNGEIHLLLPLSWLAGEKRYKEIYSQKMMPDVTICSTRPSFSEDGKTYPSREYGLFKWEFRGGFCITSGQLSWLSYERNKK
jgi:hypothetical protein